jgi:AraC-like DNA-binding protein
VALAIGEGKDTLMLDQTCRRNVPFAFEEVADATRATPAPNPWQEEVWRRRPDGACPLAAQPSVLASRWFDGRTFFRREQAVAPADRYVISLCLRPTRMRLLQQNQTVVDGIVQVGLLVVTAPGQAQTAEFSAVCDFLHLYVAAEYLHRHLAAPDPNLNGFVARDPLAAELGRTLTHGSNAGNPLFAQSIGQAIVMRLLTLQATPPRQTALSKWRLRRVLDYIAANIAEPISLSDLAAVAGLSRMHFAAQFRAAAGCSPHEYLLLQRIECAKAALSEATMPLAEVALSVGFQTQSHFSTVFKRFTGETPGRWQRNVPLRARSDGPQSSTGLLPNSPNLAG